MCYSSERNESAYIRGASDVTGSQIKQVIRAQRRYNFYSGVP